MAQFPCLLDQHIFDTWYSNIPDDGDLSYEELKDKLKEDFCLQRTQIIGSRNELNSRKQKHGDKVKDRLCKRYAAESSISPSNNKTYFS